MHVILFKNYLTYLKRGSLLYNTCRSITIVSYQFCFEASLVCRRYVRVHYPVFDLPLNGTVLVILTKRVLCLFIVRSGVWSLAWFCFFLAVLEKSKAICICNFKCTLEINKWHLAVMKLLLSPTCFRQFLFFLKLYFIESLWYRWSTISIFLFHWWLVPAHWNPLVLNWILFTKYFKALSLFVFTFV